MIVGEYRYGVTTPQAGNFMYQGCVWQRKTTVIDGRISHTCGDVTKWIYAGEPQETKEAARSDAKKWLKNWIQYVERNANQC